MSLKFILWAVAIFFLIQGTFTAFLRKDEYFIKRGIEDDGETIKKARMNIFIVNLLMWGGAIILINLFL